MISADDRRDASGLVAAYLSKDQWAIGKLHDLADGWAVADVLAEYLSDAIRQIDDPFRQEVAVAAIAQPGDYRGPGGSTVTKRDGPAPS